jgi:hypothetical protein
MALPLWGFICCKAQSKSYHEHKSSDLKSCIQNEEAFAKMSDTLIFFLLISAGNLPVIKTKWVSRLKGNLVAATKYIARKSLACKRK